jgi:mono/diheme cytochrome c family protein
LAAFITSADDFPSGGLVWNGAVMNLWRLSILLFLLHRPAAAESWETVSSLFQERCVMCHSGDSAPLGLRLDSFDGVMAGSENGAVVVPGAADTSPLFHRVTGSAEPRMPLDGPPFLDEAEITAIADWILFGASGPTTDTPLAQIALPDPREDGKIVHSEVAPIFGRSCIECHSDSGKLGAPPEGLRLDSYQAILAGGDRIVVIPGNAVASEVVRRITGLASPRMPFDGPPWLSDEETALIVEWIAGGALSDAGEEAPIPVGGRVRLRGLVTGPNEIDGAAFAMTGQTRIDDQVSVGDSAEVRARIAPDGSLVAERLRER